MTKLRACRGGGECAEGSGLREVGIRGEFLDELVPFLHADFIDGFRAVGDVEDGRQGAVSFVLDDLLDGFGGDCGGFGQVDAGDLKGVEEQAGAFGVEIAVGDALGDERDGTLDGGTVLERGEIEVGVDVGVGGERLGLARGVVVEAEGLAAEAFAAAAVAVGENVAALEVLNVWLWHETPTPGEVCKVRTDKELSLDLGSPDGREHRSVGSSSDLRITLI